MSTIESDMLGYEELGTVAGPAVPLSRRGEWAPLDAEATRKLGELIRDIRVAMLVTVAADGRLRSRPMVTQTAAIENGELWFFTAAPSGKVDEIEREHEVNLAYAEPRDQRFVSVSGRARAMRDAERARRLWSPEMKTWFAGGPEDPGLALLRVRVWSAEYWDAHGGKMAGLVARSKTTPVGEAPAGARGREIMVVAR